ncbi:MAG: hypothetical protein CM15mP56_0010 [Alphaproteobacteria bacterium]|nr:MAG: hypothetical protein CM15mP56_0010 [Alphaproteobacteria bacterium]
MKVSLVKELNWGIVIISKKVVQLRPYSDIRDGSKIFMTFEGTSQNPGGQKIFKC